jgi:hypothetical protein
MGFAINLMSSTLNKKSNNYLPVIFFILNY